MTDKELIISWLENLTMYEKDYDTLNMLLQTNNKFFVRVMTELAKGNLHISDFETVIGGISYDKSNEERFQLSRKIEKDLDLILGANDSMNRFNASLNNLIYENLLVSGDRTDLIEEVVDEDVYNFFRHTPESSQLYRQHKNILLKLYNESKIDSAFLNRYIGVPIIPINYNDVILTEDDKHFALSKGITMEEVKKIKSITYYYRTKGVNNRVGDDDDN